MRCLELEQGAREPGKSDKCDWSGRALGREHLLEVVISGEKAIHNTWVVLLKAICNGSYDLPADLLLLVLEVEWFQWIICLY